MSYLVLARKHRPQTFEEVVGQRPVVKTLQNSLKRNRVAHAILFSGVRGVGKTTLARLMAKALNCETGPTPIPCNSCLCCKQIMAGSAIDLHEIDGASNRGIQEVRELKDKIKYMPTSARYKVIIIDEVHMLTNEAFNALLKTLEEPPEHVYFMFATTELHKIPITILSRCQRYELRRVSSDDLTKHFSKLAELERIELESSALSLIVREAGGSVRDGLSLLDQVLSYGESPITTKDVTEVLGLVNREVILTITRALLTGNRKEALDNLAETFRFGMDVRRFITDLLESFRALLLIKIEGCEELLDLPPDEIKTIRELAQVHSAETIHQKLNLLMRTAEDIRYSVQPRLALETAFISIIESGNVVSVDTLLAKLESALSHLPDGGPEVNEPKSEPPSPTIPPPSDSPPTEEAQQAVKPPASEQPVTLEEPPPAETEEKLQEMISPESENTISQGAHPEDPAGKDIRKDWPEFIDYIRERKEWMAQNLQQAASVKENGQELIIDYEDPAECTLLRSKENRQILTEYVLDFFQKDYTIHLVIPDESDDPGMKESEGPKKRRQKLASNPLVRMTQEIFNGQLGDIRIGPLSR